MFTSYDFEKKGRGGASLDQKPIFVVKMTKRGLTQKRKLEWRKKMLELPQKKIVRERTPAKRKREQGVALLVFPNKNRTKCSRKVRMMERSGQKQTKGRTVSNNYRVLGPNQKMLC